jgi:DNA polymerase-3 subunit beta
MNINIHQTELKNAIEKVERLLHKSLFAVLDNVLLTADNNQITITVNNLCSTLTVNVDGEIIDPGTILIDKSNFKLIKKLSGILNITSSDNLGIKEINEEEEKEDVISNTVIIKANRNLKFVSNLPEQYPEMPKDINSEAFIIPENIFKDKLKIKAFVAKGHFRQIFNGVLIFKDDMVACNTHYLARYILNVENKCEDQMNIPIQSIEELNKISNNKTSSALQFYYKKDEDEMRYIKIVGNGFIYTTRLVEGVYPNHNNIIPQSSCTMVNVDKSKLRDTLEFAFEIVKDVELRPIMFNITNQFKIFTSEGIDKSMSEILPSKIQGEELKICFNVGYMDDILKIISEDKISIELSGKLSPAVFKGENNEDELYVLVPIRFRDDEEEDQDIAV